MDRTSSASIVSAGQSLIVPADRQHGFRNSGTTTLHIHAVLASPVFEATVEGATETVRRWSVGSSSKQSGFTLRSLLPFAITRSYAACSRSPTLGPAFLRRFTPRWLSRNSSMNSAHIFGPPSLNSLARMPSSSLTGRYL